MLTIELVNFKSFSLLDHTFKDNNPYFSPPKLFVKTDLGCSMLLGQPRTECKYLYYVFLDDISVVQPPFPLLQREPVIVVLET